jgi:class 3 adenylate cyclase
MDTAGDGFFATFDGPARAIRCGCAIREALGEIELSVRTGIHTGECELMGDKVGGIAVHTAARVLGKADPGEVLASQTVRDLVAGSDLTFRDRGVHTLEGIPGEWRLFAAEHLPDCPGASNLSAGLRNVAIPLGCETIGRPAA